MKLTIFFASITVTMGGDFKNIIMLIPDGCDDGVLSLARWYKNDILTVDTLRSRPVHPFMANSLMTDSAPGGTAYSSGQLTTDKFIAVGPRRNDLLSILDSEDMFEAYAPIPTVLEKANSMGLSTGLVATSRVTHATPAAFAAHVDSRTKEAQIAKQMAFNGIDIVMGGGRKNMLPAAACNVTKEGEPTGARADCLNLEDELISRGYNICTTKDEMMSLEGEKAWCSFASGHMSPDIDRQYFRPTEPSIAEMTEKSIELLSKNDNGFFLMVEGSQVDWAGHANDPIWMVTDFIAWDDAVNVAVNFASANCETLVLALPDHNTGGLKLGNYKHNYLDRTVEFAREPLLGMKMTSNGVVKDLKNPTGEELKARVAENWNIELTDEDVSRVLEYNETYKDKFLSNPIRIGPKKDIPDIPLNWALARIVSEEYTIAGWSSHGHNAEDVPMWVYGMDPDVGVIRNTDVGHMIAELMGGLEGFEDVIYVDVAKSGMEWSVDVSDPTSEIAMVEGHVFPLDTDYVLTHNGRKKFPSVTIYAPMTNKLYLSAAAIEWIKEQE